MSGAKRASAQSLPARRPMLPGCLPWLPNPLRKLSRPAAGCSTPGRPSPERSRHSRTHDEKTLVTGPGRGTEGRAQPVPQTPGAIHGHEVRRHDPDAEVDLRREAHRLHSQLRIRFPERTEGTMAMPKGQERSNREKKKPKQPPKPVAPPVPGIPRQPWKK